MDDLIKTNLTLDELAEMSKKFYLTLIQNCHKVVAERNLSEKDSRQMWYSMSSAGNFHSYNPFSYFTNQPRSLNNSLYSQLDTLLTEKLQGKTSTLYKSADVSYNAAHFAFNKALNVQFGVLAFCYTCEELPEIAPFYGFMLSQVFSHRKEFPDKDIYIRARDLHRKLTFEALDFSLQYTLENKTFSSERVFQFFTHSSKLKISPNFEEDFIYIFDFVKSLKARYIDTIFNSHPETMEKNLFSSFGINYLNSSFKASKLNFEDKEKYRKEIANLFPLYFGASLANFVEHSSIKVEVTLKHEIILPLPNISFIDNFLKKFSYHGENTFSLKSTKIDDNFFKITIIDNTPEALFYNNSKLHDTIIQLYQDYVDISSKNKFFALKEFVSEKFPLAIDYLLLSHVIEKDNQSIGKIKTSNNYKKI